MRVGVDLDGVVYDFARSLRHHLMFEGYSSKYNMPRGEVSCWHFYREWGMTDEEFVQHCNDGVDKRVVFYYGSPRDGARSAIDFIKTLGHSIHIVTDRQFGSVPENSHNNTKFWLSDYQIQYDTLDFSADKTIVPTDIFIEDKLENYDALEAAGVESWLVTRPWNDMDDDRRRVKSIQEFATMIGYRS